MEPQIAYYTVPLDDWGCEIIVVVTPDGIFFPIVDVCAIIGIADHKQQVGQLKVNEVTALYVKKWPVPTPTRGKQVKNCLHRAALGYWLGYVDSRRARAAIRPNLLKLQQDILAAAEHCLFGDVPGLTVSSSAIAFQRRLGPINEPITLPESDDAIVDETGIALSTTVTGSLAVGPCPNCSHRLVLDFMATGVYLREEVA